MLYFIVVITAFFQATVINSIAVANIRPDALLILVVFAALHKDMLNAVGIGLLAGLLKDILSVGPFINTLTFAFCAFCVSFFAGRFYRQSRIAELLIVAAASCIVTAVYLFWFSRWPVPPPVFMLIMRVGIPALFYTVLASPLEFFILKKILD